MNRSIHITRAALVLVALASCAQAQQAEFIPIPGRSVIPGRNPDFCGLSGTSGYSGVRVSADGRVVATVVYAPGQVSGAVPSYVARWTAQTGTQVITPVLTGLYPAVGISADGSTILGETWRWTQSGGYSSLLPQLSNPIGQQTRELFGCSDDARTLAGIQGIYPDPGDMFTLHTTDGTLNVLPRSQSFPTGYFYFNSISGDGHIVGGSARNFDPSDPLAPTTYAGVIIGSTGPTIITPELPQAGVTDLSFDGRVAVGYLSQGFTLRAFRWTAADGIEIFDSGLNASDGSYARATSRDGGVVVGDYLRFGIAGNRAWTLRAGTGLVDLQDDLVNNAGLGAQLAGWQLVVATDVSADGNTIVGQGINPEGCEQAFLVRLRSTTCAADFNGSGVLSPQDIFDYLSAWFSADPRADLNGNGLSVQDIFDFLGAWFAGC